VSTIFISYASQDRDTARDLAGRFEAHGHSVWWDRTIPPGRVYDEVIQEALHAARCVVVLWSSHSVQSNWVKVEAEESAARGLLVPVLIERVTPPIQFKRIQAADLSEWRGDENDPEFRSLRAAIERVLGRPASAAAPQAVVRRESSGLRRTAMTVVASVAATLAVVAAVLVYRGGETGGGEIAGGGAPATESAPVSTAPAPDVKASPAPPRQPQPTTGVNTSGAAAADAPALPRGELINLVAPQNGGELITATHADWAKTVDGDENSHLWQGNTEAVFGFKDNRSATVAGVEVLVKGTSQYTVGEMEVLVSTSGPDGPFTLVQVVKPRNLLIVKERYQRTTFTPRTARYVKVRVIKSHTANSTPALEEWRLLGTLD
jgi:hypothetical protein